MPKEFTECVEHGGKVRTIRKGKDLYQHLCTLNGKTTAGEVKRKKKGTGS